MNDGTIIGIDLAKRVFQLLGARADGSVDFRKKLSRSQAAVSPEPAPMHHCHGGLCDAHESGRRIGGLVHKVRIVPPAYVKPF